ncbi:MAG: isopentenyl phosphate kinase [Candidatus Thermoplasmatota archaeon]|jgi:isopentenyl phosphate kinase|nr:isopentenyl phosphate kinase [Candidatus Thermoplasmatota archaeon]
MTTIVKLGGSIITDKTQYRRFMKQDTEKAVSMLSSLGDDLVLVHGGGSYGHIKAREYGIPGPINERSRKGFSLIHCDMLRLNGEVSEILISHDYRFISLPPAAFIFGRTRSYSAFMKYFESGIMPVTFGDVYVKSDTEYGIYSGDTLVYDLARIFMPERVIFLSDVDGIFNRNPKLYSDAKLLSRLDEDATFQPTAIDVTGGIARKLEIMKKVRKYAKSVYLINGLKPERLRMLDSPDLIGTVIK